MSQVSKTGLTSEAIQSIIRDLVPEGSTEAYFQITSQAFSGVVHVGKKDSGLMFFYIGKKGEVGKDLGECAFYVDSENNITVSKELTSATLRDMPFIAHEILSRLRMARRMDRSELNPPQGEPEEQETPEPLSMPSPKLGKLNLQGIQPIEPTAEQLGELLSLLNNLRIKMEGGKASLHLEGTTPYKIDDCTVDARTFTFWLNSDNFLGEIRFAFEEPYRLDRDDDPIIYTFGTYTKIELEGLQDSQIFQGKVDTYGWICVKGLPIDGIFKIRLS